VRSEEDAARPGRERSRQHRPWHATQDRVGGRLSEYLEGVERGANPRRTEADHDERSDNGHGADDEYRHAQARFLAGGRAHAGVSDIGFASANRAMISRHSSVSRSSPKFARTCR
jgi:hypothetical protein